MNHPIQPIAKDFDKMLRFKENAIVIYLLKSHPTCDLNKLAMMDFSKEDRQQFAQLIGYTLSGYGDLSYVDEVAYEAAKMTANAGISADKARISVLEAKLETLQVLLRDPIAMLYGIHPGDLCAGYAEETSA